MRIEHTFDTLFTMGYRGKQLEQGRARSLRAAGWTVPDIAAELAVAKSSVALWVRDVPYVAGPRRLHRPRPPNRLQQAKQAEIDFLLAQGRVRIGQLSDREFLVAGTALYAGEGTKGGGGVSFANSDPRMVAVFCAWLRRSFEIDEARLRVRVYLHEGLDHDAAQAFWSEVTGVPLAQFRRGYRAKADPTIRRNKHHNGCCYVRYNCSRTHRAVMGLVDALLTSDAIPG